MVDGGTSKQESLRLLPSVDEILISDAGRAAIGEMGAKHTAALVRGILEEARSEIIASAGGTQTRDLKTEVIEALNSRRITDRDSRLRRVINATGVLLHTNLGRAPLSAAARQAVIDAAGYCTLELSLLTGKRARRAPAAEALICELTGAEAALVVNNCSAAAFLVLSELAAGGEVIVSRGELVEIGGDFRVPDVLERSGARLKEVGTTNRTKIGDYARAIATDTRMILKVHPSNYRIVGFTTTPGLVDLVTLSHDNGLLLYEDIGSGSMIDLSPHGLADEPAAAASLAAGVDLVTFSGDKLLGGPQSGIIAGKADLVSKLRQNPLYRVLRPGKLDLAALEATLGAYRRDPFNEIPLLTMLSADITSITARSRRLIEEFRRLYDGSDLKLELVEGSSAVGGGSAPSAVLPSMLIAVTNVKMPAARLELKLRQFESPILARIADGRVLIDLRTVPIGDEADLLRAIVSLA